VPTDFQHIREEIGLAGPSWTDLGKTWHALGTLWLRAEGQLTKLGRTDLKFDEVRKSSLPEPLKDWIYSKLMHTDATRPNESFGDVFTDFLRGLPWNHLTQGDNVVEQIWCRTGRSGIVIFLVGLFWQAEYSGGGKQWKENMKRVESIFKAILNAPVL
jgi:hypothetical protein